MGRMIEERIMVVEQVRVEMIGRLHNFELISDKNIEEEESIKILKGTLSREIEPRLKIYKRILKSEN